MSSVGAIEIVVKGGERSIRATGLAAVVVAILEPIADSVRGLGGIVLKILEAILSKAKELLPAVVKALEYFGIKSNGLNAIKND